MERPTFSEKDIHIPDIYPINTAVMMPGRIEGRIVEVLPPPLGDSALTGEDFANGIAKALALRDQAMHTLYVIEYKGPDGALGRSNPVESSYFTVTEKK